MWVILKFQNNVSIYQKIWKKCHKAQRLKKNKNEILKSSSQCSKLPNKCLKHINNSNILFHKHFLWKQLLEKMNANSKKISPKIHQSTIYYAGLHGRWDKRIVDQESNVPSIISFYTFYRLRALKTLYFHFSNFIKKK